MKKLAIIGAMMLALGGCAQTGETKKAEAPAGGNPEVTKAIADAEAAVKKAASVNGEWRDLGDFIKSAKAAAAKGENKEALALAKKTIDQAEMGYKQALEQKNAKPWLF